MKKGEWTEIFRAGDYGDKGAYTAADLDGMVANFNSEDQVPIVIGHPQTDSPAWGWISAVKRVGEVLQGKIGELHAEFSKALAEKMFKNRSVRIVKTAAGPKLLHLGFLGAALPQVEGLKQTAQFAGDGECVDYGFELPGASGQGDNSKEKAMTEEEIKQMQADLKKAQDDLAAEKAARQSDKDASAKAAGEAKAEEFARFVETEMVATGKIPQGRKEEIVAFMRSLSDGETADFSFSDNGATKSVKPVEWFKDYVRKLPAADFTRELPGGAAQTGAGKQTGKLPDLSHKV